MPCSCCSYELGLLTSSELGRLVGFIFLACIESPVWVTPGGKRFQRRRLRRHGKCLGQNKTP
jgi:hypothetical protein